MAKNKVINFELLAPANNMSTYKVLDRMLENHAELYDARIALAWRKNLTADKDGHLVLGKCVKVSDMHKELADFDFVILLNREAWEDFTAEQRDALVDHELCHAARAFDEDGNPKVDERKRPVWRTRKHDIEEFEEVVKRHGCYKRDLERFIEAAARKREAPLFDPPLVEASILREGKRKRKDQSGAVVQ